MRGLAALDAAPELLFGSEQEMLVERVGWNRQLNPFAVSGDNGKHRGAGLDHPHVVLQLTAANDLAVRRALEAAGVEFIDENGGGAGVRLRKPAKEKSRK
jgi:hypothetical protein